MTSDFHITTQINTLTHPHNNSIVKEIVIFWHFADFKSVPILIYTFQMILNTEAFLLLSTLYLFSYEILFLDNDFIQSCCTDLEKTWKELGSKLTSSRWSRMQANNILFDCQNMRAASISLSAPTTKYICPSAVNTHLLSVLLCISSIVLKAAAFLFLSVLF